MVNMVSVEIFCQLNSSARNIDSGGFTTHVNKRVQVSCFGAANFQNCGIIVEVYQIGDKGDHKFLRD